MDAKPASTSHRTCTALAVSVLLFLTVIDCATQYPEIKPGKARAFRIPIVRSDGSRDSTYCLFSVPDGYSPDRPWPLVVVLHGYGSSGPRFHDLWGPVARDAGYVLLAPQGEQRTSEGIGWGWGPGAEEVVLRSIDALRNTVRIDRSRVFLAGFSQGGHLAYNLALKFPHLFGGIAPLGAGRDIPESANPEAVRGLRVYIGHGSLEPNLSEVREFATTLRAHGCEVLLRVYPNVGHGLPQPISDELAGILAFFSGED